MSNITFVISNLGVLYYIFFHVFNETEYDTRPCLKFEFHVHIGLGEKKIVKPPRHFSFGMPQAPEIDSNLSAFNEKDSDLATALYSWTVYIFTTKNW